MAKRRLGIMILLLCFCICALPCAVLAISITDAKEPIITDEDCTLVITYRHEGVAISNQTVKLYRIADVAADCQYTHTASFEASGLILNGIQTNGEWNVIRSTLDAYILANDIEPVMSVMTDDSGNASFESLKPGLYLASAVHVIQDDVSCAFDSALVSLPGLRTDGYWRYHVAVSAKSETLPPVEPDEKIELKVIKLWKGDEKQNTRPQHVEVEIFQDGTSYAFAMLSEDNNWSHSWLAEDDGADWKVVERNVPSGYAMTVERRDTTFIITNTLQNQPHPQPPKTGDTSNVLLYTVLMYVSGAMLVILGVTGKRKSYEETNESDCS